MRQAIQRCGLLNCLLQGAGTNLRIGELGADRAACIMDNPKARLRLRGFGFSHTLLVTIIKRRAEGITKG